MSRFPPPHEIGCADPDCKPARVAAAEFPATKAVTPNAEGRKLPSSPTPSLLWRSISTDVIWSIRSFCNCPVGGEAQRGPIPGPSPLPPRSAGEALPVLDFLDHRCRTAGEGANAAPQQWPHAPPDRKV